MNYWPLSVLRSSPLMPAHYVWEIDESYRTNRMSAGCGLACVDVAIRTPPALDVRGFHVVYPEENSETEAAYVILTEYPTEHEFLRMERGFIVMLAPDEPFGMMLAKH